MGIPFEANGLGVRFEANGVVVPFNKNCAGVPLEADRAGIPFEAEDACIRFNTACTGVLIEADGAGVRFDTNSTGMWFDVDFVGPSSGVIAAGLRGRMGVGCTTSGTGPLRDEFATEARRFRESGGRTLKNAADPSSSHSIVPGARGAIAADAQ